MSELSESLPEFNGPAHGLLDNVMPDFALAQRALHDGQEAAGTAWVLAVAGDWVAHTIGPMCSRIDAGLLHDGQKLHLDVRGLGAIDTIGARQIIRLLGQELPVSIIGHHPNAARLLVEVAQHHIAPPQASTQVSHWGVRFLDTLGRGLVDFWREAKSSLSFLGETLAALYACIRNPKKIRWVATFALMESAGLNALAIVVTLSFFIGAVVAYMGASTLARFGFTIFTVDLVGISVLREFAPLITAIILAGRSDSAFAAQIGAMRMNQEVDAMKTLGITEMDMLVVPRVLAMLVMTPILTFAAMLAGMLGGGFVSVLQLDISPTLFLSRLHDNVGLTHFWTGMVKTPFFAFVMAIIGCRQGLMVEHDVISLGRNTTAAVVQAIFMVIVLDALFAMVFLQLDV